MLFVEELKQSIEELKRKRQLQKELGKWAKEVAPTPEIPSKPMDHWQGTGGY